MQIRILSAADIRRALTARDAVDAMRIAFGELSGGTAAVPVRSHLESHRGLMLVMPAVLGRHGALGTKVVSVFPDNPSRGAPMVQGAVLLLEAETGRASALLDGASLTEMRTAAGSALATELLAPGDADVLAVFGAGAQGRSHVELLARTRRLREVRIVSRSGTSAERLAARLSEAADTLTPEDHPGPPPILRAVRDAAEALDGARLIVTATGSSRPVFDARDLEPGAHVNAVGSYRPDMQELDAERGAARPRRGGSARGGVGGGRRPRRPAGGRPDRHGHRRRRARRDRERRGVPPAAGSTTSPYSSPSGTRPRTSRWRKLPSPAPNDRISEFWRPSEPRQAAAERSNRSPGERPRETRSPASDTPAA